MKLLAFPRHHAVPLVEGLVAIMRAARRLTTSIATRVANRRHKVQEKPADGPDHGDDPAGEPSPERSMFTPEFEKFCVDDLETGDPTWSISATPAYQAWRMWCHVHTVKACSQKRFGQMMRSRFTKDHNNGYPRYLGVRAKSKAPALRVVATNG